MLTSINVPNSKVISNITFRRHYIYLKSGTIKVQQLHIMFFCDFYILNLYLKHTEMAKKDNNLDAIIT